MQNSINFREEPTQIIRARAQDALSVMLMDLRKKYENHDDTCMKKILEKMSGVDAALDVEGEDPAEEKPESYDFVLELDRVAAKEGKGFILERTDSLTIDAGTTSELLQELCDDHLKALIHHSANAYWNRLIFMGRMKKAEKRLVSLKEFLRPRLRTLMKLVQKTLKNGNGHGG